jgi:anti-anti-sigma factor
VSKTGYNSALASEIIANYKLAIMIIETTVVGKVHIIKLAGRLDAVTANSLNVAGERCVGDGARHIVLDLGELQYISSAGLGSIVMLSKRLKGLGGSVSLCGVRGMVKEVFQVTGLFAIFKVFDSSEAACQSI